jgi:hypothetical protein
MVGFIHYIDGQPMPTLSYYLNGERVSTIEAKEYFINMYAHNSLMGYCDADSVDEYWEGRYNETGREVICNLTHGVLEIRAYYHPE